MKRRSPRFIGLIIVMSAISVVPQFFWTIDFGLGWYRIGRPPVFATFADVMKVRKSPFDSAVIWKGQLCSVTSDNKGKRRITLSDPDTGTTTDLGVSFNSHEELRLLGDGNDLWIFGGEGAWQVRGTNIEKITAAFPAQAHPERILLFNGKPAFWNENVIYVLKDGAWSLHGAIALATEDRRCWERQRNTSFVSDDGGIHLIREGAGKILYYDSVVYQPETTETMPSVAIDGSFVMRDSALVMVAGKPVIMVPEWTWTMTKSTFRFRALRHTENGWAEFASMEMPFAAKGAHVVTDMYGAEPHLVATTLTLATQVFRLTEDGFQATAIKVPGHGVESIRDKLLEWSQLWCMVLIIGWLMAVVTSRLMHGMDNRSIRFGAKQARLATISRRSLARGIDLAWMLSGTMFVGAALFRGVDWDSFVVACLHKQHHRAVLDAINVAACCLLVLIAQVAILAYVQGRHGLTPGKWLCSLRTVQTTLSRCGFARSLLREILLVFDSGYLCLWTPGILFIAFTEKHQRLGDLIADTVVVEADSLTNQTASGAAAFQCLGSEANTK